MGLYKIIIHEVQENEGMKFANKISTKHIEFKRHKMNVKVAAQLYKITTGLLLMLVM